MSRDYTEQQDFDYTPLADNLPTMSQKYNTNLNRIRSYVPNGILDGGAVDSTTATVINFEDIKFHFDAGYKSMTSPSFNYSALTDGIHYVYFKSDASGMNSIKESDYLNARAAREATRLLGILAVRIDMTSNMLMEIDDIREIIPEMLEDLSEMKYYEVGQYLETKSSATQWTVVHNLDTEYISSVQCYKDFGGGDWRQIMPNYIQVVDKDTLLIDWGGTSVAGRIKIER